jgi:hypothetical protein
VTNAQASTETIAQLRKEQQRPSCWIQLTEGECYQLLAGTVPESVKLAVYDLTNEAFDAKLQQNAEKPSASIAQASQHRQARV